MLCPSVTMHIGGLVIIAAGLLLFATVMGYFRLRAILNTTRRPGGPNL
jgi:hypothetical protein